MKKTTILLAVLALTVTMTAAAQTAPVSSFSSLSSNTKDATAGIFKTDVDNYLDVHNYSRVLGDDNNWFGFITNKNNYLNLGYARNIGDIYLGAWYQGRFLSFSGGAKTTTLVPSYNDDAGILTQTVKTTTYAEDWLYSANQLEVLLGIAGHGIKVGIFESLYSNYHDGQTGRTITVTDYLDGHVRYQNKVDEFTDNGGYIRPYVGWGSAFTVAGFNLRPYANFGLTFYSDETIDNYSNYHTLNGTKQDSITTIGDGNNNGYLMPSITIGSKLDMSHDGGKSSTFGLEYGIDIRSYSNSYGATGVSGSVDGTVSWSGGSIATVNSIGSTTTTTTSGDLSITKRSDITHKVTPSYQLTGQLENGLRFGLSASMPITYNSWDANSYVDKYTITKTSYNSGSYGNTTTTTWTRDYNANQEYSAFTTALNLGVGASYQLVPNRFTVNAGIRVTPFQYLSLTTTQLGRSLASESTTKTVDEFGNVITNTQTVTAVAPSTTNNGRDYVSTQGIWSYCYGTIAGGFTFNFNPAVALDLLTTVSNATTNASSNSVGGKTFTTVSNNYANFYLSITDVNVLVTVKF